MHLASYGRFQNDRLAASDSGKLPLPLRRKPPRRMRPSLDPQVATLLSWKQPFVHLHLHGRYRGSI
jgi:hypothetical protein